MAVITINGNRFEVPDGSSVVVSGNSITVGGSVLATGLTQEVHVKWEGPVGSLKCNTCEITGDVNGNVGANTVRCGNVKGDVDCNTVTCGNVGGDVDDNVVNRR